MTFDPVSHPGPSSGGARSRDPAAGGGRSGDARSQAHRDPIAWAYDPLAQAGCDPRSRVDRPWAADHAASPCTGGPDPYDYAPAPRARGPYDYGADPWVEDFYDDRPDPDYSRRGPRRTHRHRKLGTTAKLLGILCFAGLAFAFSKAKRTRRSTPKAVLTDTSVAISWGVPTRTAPPLPQ